MRSLLLLLCPTLLFAQAPKAPAPESFERWEKEIAAIEKRLKETPPAKESVAFAGSSSIRLWDLKKSFPKLAAYNVGFGGSEIRDVTHFAPRLILPYAPKTIVFYAGDNDIAKNRTPEQVLADFTAFDALIHQALPKTRILYIPVKPSIKRWSMFDTQKKANALVQAYCGKHEHLEYVDVVPKMLGKDGMPIPEHFVKDGLHMTEKGYEVWTALIADKLSK